MFTCVYYIPSRPHFSPIVQFDIALISFLVDKPINSISYRHKFLYHRDGCLHSGIALATEDRRQYFEKIRMSNAKFLEIGEEVRKDLKELREIPEKFASLDNAPPPPSVTPVGFLNFPFEIRRMIYRYCLPRKRVVEVSGPCFNTRWPFEDIDYCLDFEGYYWDRNKNKNSILLLSKQISEEALDVLYGENVFKAYLNGEGQYYLRKNFTEVNRQRMRRLLLIAQPAGVSYTPNEAPENRLWSTTLSDLKVLRIVAQQPVHVEYYYTRPTLEEDINCWVRWIRPFLQCFGQHLSNETVVEVDYDGRTETSEIVNESLPAGYREVQCHFVGDLIFKRGRFSWESGYWDEDDVPTGSWDV